MKLIELFVDFQIDLKGSGQFGRYPQTFRVEEKAPFTDAKGTVQVVSTVEKRRKQRWMSGLPPDPVESYRLSKLKTEELPKAMETVLTLEKLQEHVKRLAKRYPERGFKLRKWKNYQVLCQKSKSDTGKRKRDRVPIYIDLATQRFFIPSSFIKNKPRLVKFIVSRTLGALGVSQSKYVRKK